MTTIGAYRVTRHLGGSVGWRRYEAAGVAAGAIARFWITVTRPQRQSHERLWRALDWRHPGLVPLAWLGALADGDALVEGPIFGTRTGGGLPLALAVTRVVAAVHQDGHALGGLRPETILVTPEGSVLLAPRSDRFALGATPSCEPQAAPFTSVFLAPELHRCAEPTAAADVFSICAMLAAWVGCRDRPWIAAGLATRPEDRPTLAELRIALELDGASHVGAGAGDGAGI